MLPVQLPLSSLVVFQLILKLSLVLQPDQVHSQLLQRVQLPVFQLTRRLVVPDQHGVLHFFLGPLLVQLLHKSTAEHQKKGEFARLAARVTASDGIELFQVHHHGTVGALLMTWHGSVTHTKAPPRSPSGRPAGGTGATHSPLLRLLQVPEVCNLLGY